ncbi:hypothetical protein BDR22DRAFT_819714 [Usnea florida]
MDLIRTRTLTLARPTMSPSNAHPSPLDSPSLSPTYPTSGLQVTPTTPTTPSSPCHFPAPGIPTRNPNHTYRTSDEDDDDWDPRLDARQQSCQHEVTLKEALLQGPKTMTMTAPGGVPKNPRRLSEFDANLTRRERRKSKAWSGVGDVGEEGENGEVGEGRRKSSGLLDAEELKGLLFGQLRRVCVIGPTERCLWWTRC